jgi:hypothetical protein
MELFERLSGQGFVVSTRIRGVQYLLNRTALIIPSRTAKHSVCRRLRTVLVTCVAGALGFALPPVAVARGDEIGLGACTPSALSQPFARWADWFSYESAPGGDFERSTRWTLSGGARTVSGGEPFAAAGTVGSFSLLLPGGAVAESPSFCVDAAIRRSASLSPAEVPSRSRLFLGAPSSRPGLPLAQGAGCPRR